MEEYAQKTIAPNVDKAVRHIHDRIDYAFDQIHRLDKKEDYSRHTHTSRRRSSRETPEPSQGAAEALDQAEWNKSRNQDFHEPRHAADRLGPACEHPHAHKPF